MDFMECRERILSDSYYDLITDYSPEPESIENNDICTQSVNSVFHVIYASRRGISDLFSNYYDYQNLPKLYGLMQIGESAGAFNPDSLIASGISQMQQPPLSLVGRGVIICIIDTGIDYTSDAFRDANGNSRILAIWDQTIQDGEPPEGFGFGTEYTREQINQALQSEEPYSTVPSRDTIGHGTVMAGVAAGSSVQGGFAYLGAAPEADIVVVKLKECKSHLRDFYFIPDSVPAYQENDIMLGVAYANSFAREFRIPVVICIGVGTNMGDHGGNSFLSRYLSSVAVQRSRGVVVCGGNEGNAAHHYQGSLRTDLAEGENSVAAEIRVGENCRGFYMELWGNLPDVLSVSIRSPGGETVPVITTRGEQEVSYGFVYERSRVTARAELADLASGEQLVRFRVENPTQGIWTFRVQAVGEIYNGIFHMWLPITEFLSSPVTFLEPSPYVTLTEPALAGDVIGVSTYNSENNSFYLASGRGFSRTGAIRPDWAAPGVNISTLRGKGTGSSLAAAVTAGAVAQFMQWAVVEQNNLDVESREIKNYFIRGVSRDPGLTYPNREWGAYGIIVSRQKLPGKNCPAKIAVPFLPGKCCPVFPCLEGAKCGKMRIAF